MYRLAILLALMILAAAGCGGSDGDEDEGGSSPAAVAQAPKERAAGKRADKPGAEGEKKAGKSRERKPAPKTIEDLDTDGDGEVSEDEVHEAEEDAYLNLRARKQQVLARTVARAVLLRFGMKLADVEVLDGGRKLNVAITRASACRGVASQEPQMVVSFKEALPALKSVSFEVAGTGKAFGYYVLRCKHPKMPDGPGRTVFTHTGVGGVYTSKLLHIRAKRWALEYENLGSTLVVIVVPKDAEAKRSYFKPVGSQKPEAGRNNYRGSGKVQLKIHGAARWSVRVKEIR